jgi:uncharacterized Rmd1/YagE family protein
MNDRLPQSQLPDSPQPGTRTAARALLIGDRIDTTGLERSDVLSTAPLAFRAGSGNTGFAAVFRYGVVALVGLTPPEEDEVLRALRPRTIGEFARHEEEAAVIEFSADRDDQIPPGGPIYLKSLAPERLLVIADALAKSAGLARDEHEVAAVFEVIEPFARKLAEKGRTPAGRRRILQHIGNALLVQHRVSGRVAVEEKPDVLWDRPAKPEPCRFVCEHHQHTFGNRRFQPPGDLDADYFQQGFQSQRDQRLILGDQAAGLQGNNHNNNKPACTQF